MDATTPTKAPAWKKSEWWLALSSFICAGLTVCGVISFDNSDYFASISQHATESIILVSGQAAIVYKYISSRNKTKEEDKKRIEAEQERQHKLEMEKVKADSDAKEAALREQIKAELLKEQEDKKIAEKPKRKPRKKKTGDEK